MHFFTTVTPKTIEGIERKRQGTDDFILNLVNQIQEFHNAFICDMHKMVDLLIATPWELCYVQQTVWHSKAESSPEMLLKEHSRYCALYYPSEYECLHLSLPKKNVSLKKRKSSSPKKIEHPSLEFTEEEETLFAKRYDEGYDFETDLRYNAWKSQKEVNNLVNNIMSIPDMNLSGLLDQMTDVPPLDMPNLYEEEIPQLPPPTKVAPQQEVSPPQEVSKVSPPQEVSKVSPPQEVSKVSPPQQEVSPPQQDVSPPPQQEVSPEDDCPRTPGTSTPPTRRSKKRRLEDDNIMGKDELNVDNLPKKLASRLSTLMEYGMHQIIYNRPFGVSDALPHSDWDTEALIIFQAIDDVSDITFNTHCQIQQAIPSLIQCRSDVVLVTAVAVDIQRFNKRLC